MTALTPFTLRPLERTSGSSSLDQTTFRVHLSAKELKNLGLVAGDRVRLSTPRGFHGFALAWLAQQTNPGNKPIVKVSDVLREKYDLILTDAVFIEKFTEAPRPVVSVEVTFSRTSEALGKYSSNEKLVSCTESALGTESLELVRVFHLILTPLRGAGDFNKGMHLRCGKKAKISRIRFQATHDSNQH